MGSPWVALASSQPATPPAGDERHITFGRLVLVRPWLPKTHRNFFVIYTATIIYHLGCAATGLLHPDSFDLPALVHLAAPGVAAAAAARGVHLAIAVGLYVSLHLETFRWSRRFLSIGLTLCLCRLCLIVWAMFANLDVGYTFWNLFLVVSIHFAQTLEPPVNPASR